MENRKKITPFHKLCGNITSVNQNMDNAAVQDHFSSKIQNKQLENNWLFRKNGKEMFCFSAS